MPIRYRFLTYRYTGGSHGAEQLMQRVWDRNQAPGLAFRPEWRPPTDVFETADTIVIKVELGGMGEEEIAITLYADLLLITGERRDETSKPGNVTYHEAGIRYGPFRAEIYLPEPIEREHVEARYERGLLEVTLPKRVMRDE